MKSISQVSRTLPRAGMLAGALVAYSLVAACTPSIPVPKAELPGEYVDIEVDGEGCPQKVSNPNILMKVRGTEDFTWRVMNRSSDKAYDGAGFCIVFSPFSGSDPICADGNSLVSKAIELGPIKFPEKDPKAQSDAVESVLFKYAVVLLDCPHKPLDPLITVRH